MPSGCSMDGPRARWMRSWSVGLYGATMGAAAPQMTISAITTRPNTAPRSRMSRERLRPLRTARKGDAGVPGRDSGVADARVEVDIQQVDKQVGQQKRH